MKQYLHIGFCWSAPPDLKALEEKFNKSIDWVRYSKECWIVWTSSDPNTWYNRLKPLLKENDDIFIVKIDINVRQGWLPTWIWDWVKEKRN